MEPVKPITDVRQISAITYGFMASKALFAALEFDLFTRISQGDATIDALSAAAGVAPNRMRTLMTALKTLGLVTEAEGVFANAPAVESYLVAGAPGDFRAYVRDVNGRFGYESFRHLEAALRGERIFPDGSFYEGIIYDGDVGGERFTSAQHTGSLGPARLMAKQVDLSGYSRLLDVGGGSGAYSIAFCKAYPDLRATILDFPQTVTAARRHVADAGMENRIDHIGGNAITTDWPHEFDVVLMSYVWSAVGRRDIETLAGRAFGALDSGGLALIHDFMVDDGHNGPDFAAWYLLGSMLDNPTAECLTGGFTEAVLSDAGFAIEGTDTMLPGITKLTRARKP